MGGREGAGQGRLCDEEDVELFQIPEYCRRTVRTLSSLKSFEFPELNIAYLNVGANNALYK